MTFDATGPEIQGDANNKTTMDIIVFSKDRACQLDALLRSIDVYFNVPHRLHILYTTTSLEYERGYDVLRRWNPEDSFIDDVSQFGQAT